jgi:hypothetical protein
MTDRYPAKRIFLVNVLAACVSASIAAHAADKPVPFQARPAAEYENKVSLDGVTIAMDVLDEPEKLTRVFGKVPLASFDILPVLVVIENKRPGPLDVKGLRVMYRPKGGREIDTTPAAEVRFADSPNRPNTSPYPRPYPIPLPERKKKSKLEAIEIEQRAFAAKMIAPGESASGFVYFQTAYHGPVTLTVSGLRDAAKDQDLFFYELPLTHR